MATLREIQLCELSVLEEMHRICEENSVEYAISCGTLLGAIRHKGFIPWDDDLDTYMSYDSFKKFEKVFKSETCFLQTEKTEPTMPYPMYKVRKNNTRVIESEMDGLDIHYGVWVDIFIYFNAGRSIITKKMQYYLYMFLMVVRCRELNKVNHNENLIQKILNILPQSFSKSLDKFLFWMIRSLGSKHSKEYFMTVNNVFDRLFYPKAVIDGQIPIEFEGKTVMGLKNWKEYLVFEYGEDYMTPKKQPAHLENLDKIIL